QRVTPRDQPVEREFSFAVPAQIHRKILIREARAEAAAVEALAMDEQRGINGHLLLRDADENGHATKIVSPDAAGPRRAQDLLDGDLPADRIEGVVDAAIGQLADRLHRIDIARGID